MSRFRGAWQSLNFYKEYVFGFETLVFATSEILSEPILPIRRIRTLHRAPETPDGPLALKDVLILVSFLILASGSENMIDRFS